MFTLTSSAALSNGGQDVHLSTNSKAPVVGLLLARVDHHGEFLFDDFYLQFFATSYGACGAATCPGAAADDDIRTFVAPSDSVLDVLHPGTYLAVLLAPADASVTATLQLPRERRGTTTIRTGGDRLGSMSMITHDTPSTAAEDAVSGTYLVASRKATFAGLMGTEGISSPGAVAGNASWTFYPYPDGAPEDASGCQLDRASAMPGVTSPTPFTNLIYYTWASYALHGKTPQGADGSPWDCWGATLTAVGAGVHHVDLATYIVTIPDAFAPFGPAAPPKSKSVSRKGASPRLLWGVTAPPLNLERCRKRAL